MYAVIGAMDAEIKSYLNHGTGFKKERWQEFIFSRGQLENKEVIIAKTGVGKTMSAMLTQKLIDSYQIEAIIFTGIAGSLDKDIEIGDIILAEDCIQHDFDATFFGFKRGKIPFSRYYNIKSDKKLLNIAKESNTEGSRIITGRILTGDQFLTQADRESHRYLVDELKGHAVEMEGASAGLVAAVNKVPFILIRVISDRADGKAPADFKKFLNNASEQLYRIVKHLLENL